MIRSGFREDISNRIHAEILQTVRGRLSVALRRPTSRKEVIEQIENESGKNLEALYEEMVDIFKSPADLLHYIETNRWAKEAISAYDYALLVKTVAFKFSGEMFDLAERSARASIDRRTFRSLTELRQVQLSAEARAFTEKAGHLESGAVPDEATIEAIFRNLSAQHNFLWSYAEASLGITISFHLSRLSRHPSLQTRWFSLRRRAKELLIPRRLLPYEVKFTQSRWLLGAARLPYGYRLINDPQAISEFFRELSSLLAEAASPAPGHFRTFFSLPGGFIRNSVEHRAKMLAADFDLLQGLKPLSPEFENALIAKELEARYMQRYFEVYQKEGLPGLVKAALEAEGGYHPLGWEFKLPDSKWRALLTFWFPWTYKQGDRLRGQYFRKWLSYHGMTLFLVLLINEGTTGEEIEIPPYVDDSFLPVEENGGSPQDTGFLERSISQKLKEKKRLVFEFEELKAKLTETREEEEREIFFEIQFELGKKIENLDEELEELKEGLKAVIQISKPEIQPLTREIARFIEEIQGLTEQYDLTTDEDEKRRLHSQVKEIEKKMEPCQQEIENILTKKADEIFQRLERE